MTTTVLLSPIWTGTQFLDNNGNLLNGGSIGTYLAGSFTNKATTWADPGATSANPNPIPLSSTGRNTAEIWLNAGLTYNLVLYARDGTTVLASTDNVKGLGVVSIVNEPYTPPVTTNGDIFIYNDGPTRLPIGSAGQVLTVALGEPAWVTSGGGGGGATLVEVGESPLTPYAPVVLADNPAGYWQYNEKDGRYALDSTTNNHRAVYNGLVTLGQPGHLPDGTTGAYFYGASSLPAENSAVAAGYTTSTNPTRFAQEVWFKTTNSNPNPICFFQSSNIPAQTGAQADRGMLMIGGSIYCVVQSGGSYSFMIGGSGLADGNWHHAVFNYDTTGTSTLWVDGVQRASQALPVGDTYGSGLYNLVVGAFNLGAAYYFKGNIQDVAFYTSPLTQNQIQAHYQAGLQKKAGSTVFQGVVLGSSPTGYWPYNEAGGSVAYDLVTGNGNFYEFGSTTPVQPASMSFGTATHGQYGQTALSFSGTAGTPAYAMSGYSTTVNPDTFTYEFWLKTTTANNPIMGFCDNNSNTPSAAGQADRTIYVNQSGHIQFWTNQADPYATVEGTTFVADGNWHHIVLTWSTKAAIYVDGKEEAYNFYIGTPPEYTSGTYYLTLTSAYADTTFTNYTGSTYAFTGSLSDVAFYSGVALAQGDIVAHYQAGVGSATYYLPLTSALNGAVTTMYTTPTAEFNPATGVLAVPTVNLTTALQVNGSTGGTGQVLTSTGTGVSWQTVSSGGGSGAPIGPVYKPTTDLFPTLVNPLGYASPNWTNGPAGANLQTNYTADADFSYQGFSTTIGTETTYEMLISTVGVGQSLVGLALIETNPPGQVLPRGAALMVTGGAAAGGLQFVTFNGNSHSGVYGLTNTPSNWAWLKLTVETGSTVTAWGSPDGTVWQQLSVQPWSSFFTSGPDSWGVICTPASTTTVMSARAY